MWHEHAPLDTTSLAFECFATNKQRGSREDRHRTNWEVRREKKEEIGVGRSSLEDASAQRVLDTARSFSVGIEALASGMKALADGVVAAYFALASESVAEGRLALLVGGACACFSFGLETTTFSIDALETGASGSA